MIQKQLIQPSFIKDPKQKENYKEAPISFRILCRRPPHRRSSPLEKKATSTANWRDPIAHKLLQESK